MANAQRLVRTRNLTHLAALSDAVKAGATPHHSSTSTAQRDLPFFEVRAPFGGADECTDPGAA